MLARARFSIDGAQKRAGLVELPEVASPRFVIVEMERDELRNRTQAPLSRQPAKACCR
jgi:hypothetical protein